MGFFDRVYSLSQRFYNSEPNTIETVSDEVDVGVDYTKGCGQDLVDTNPHKIRRTILNCRNAATDPQVKGILTDTITKSNNVFEIDCEDSGAKEYLEKRCKEWDITQFVDDCLYKGMVDGNAFVNTWIKDNKVQFRWLAFDGKNYRMKRIYGEEGEVIGYKQIAIRNTKTNKGWLSRKFDQLVEDKDYLEFSFLPDEIIDVKYAERDGTGNSIVMDILDDVDYKRSLKELMVTIPFKNNNIIQITMGNEKQPGKRLTKEDRIRIQETLYNYHEKGVLTVPYGYDAKVLKGGALPDLPNYVKYFESNIYVGMNTPEAIFSSESSNRATADIQLDSPTTGRVLFLQYNQEWVNKYVSQLFERELELNGYEGVEAKLKFNKVEGEEDTGSISGKKPIKKVTDDDNNLSGEDNGESEPVE